MTERPLVSIIIGSRSDLELAKKAEEVLNEFCIPYELKILSAHRNQKELIEYLEESKNYVKVYIAIAGLAAHLPGFIASRVEQPVIGVPRDVKLMGLDALLSIVQMPSGVPVATVGIDNAKNGAYLAIRILKIAGFKTCK
ncbi:N5-carboxyaminoimidazole ribonucleotide mutase [Ignicoccus islandicus DSM 13165]|uniref:N5-carboxyaminoimidazole ribonucleotide mutase n=1 Tax=Ignicoccus islandicus DSM 13165 TaxID=940295 RepID=A0A0U3F7P1_9CREN|nr:5-(carboxyamino)imidazole ribonucleotide mutase [Ignicoccus islandicus]ALU11657.1 N5-carboxyaminoimidazole ribonucleotide mutase [Ignicoccus islandicus DSM 13165]